MNSITSGGLTASSILTGKNAAAARPPQENAAAQDTVDIETGKTGEKKKHFLSFKDNPGKQDAMKAGAAIGGIAGGIGGAILGSKMAQAKIEATNELNSVSLNWREPITQKENLGEIPSDFYSSWSSSLTLVKGSEPVYKNVPVMENGQPLMQDKSQTFTDYGEPVVSWNQKYINTTTLTGFNHRVIEDTETIQVYEGKDSDGNDVYSEKEIVVGYYHKFDPKFAGTLVGEYQTPSVNFETGVNTGLYVGLGALAGAGIGALTGALTGAAVDHLKNGK